MNPTLHTKMPCIFILLLCLSLSQLQAQLNISADRPMANYQVNEQINFNVTSTTSGPATYEIRSAGRAPVLTSGTIELTAGSTNTINYSSSDPNFVVCRITQFGQTAQAGAAIAPYDIQPYEDEPDDFDTFWDNEKARLAAVPLNPQVSVLQETNKSTTYRVSLGHVDNRRVYGNISIPKNTTQPMAAALELPSYGSTPNTIPLPLYTAEAGNIIVMSITIHNAPYDVQDPNAYQPDNVTNRDEFYYRYAVLAGIRAIDYLFTVPEFDKEHLAVMGASQGGGLALMVAGLDDRVKLLAQAQAGLCEHSGLTYGKASGFPHYLEVARYNPDPAHEQAVAQAIKYYDAVYFSRRFKGPSFHVWGYEDEVCPPATNAAAMNQIQGSKVILHARELGHAHPIEYFTGRLEFFRRYFPNMTRLPDGTTSNNTNYGIDAGPETMMINGNTVQLNGVAELNDMPLSTVRWEKIKGPGQVTFANSRQATTNATFDQQGVYVLRLYAEDEYKLNQEALFYTAFDEITVTVGEVAPDTEAPTVVLSTTNANVTEPFTVTVNFNESISGLNLNDLVISNAIATNLSGNGDTYSFLLTPVVDGSVTVQLPANQVKDIAGNDNEASNLLTVTYEKDDDDTGGGGNGGGDPTKTDLELSIEADVSTFKVYENITYTITLTNSSDVTAENIEIPIPLPSQTAYVRSNVSSGIYTGGWTNIWTLPSLAANSQATATLTVFVLDTPGPVTLFAQLTKASPLDNDSAPDNNSGIDPSEDDEALSSIPLAGSNDNGNGGGSGGGNDDDDDDDSNNGGGSGNGNGQPVGEYCTNKVINDQLYIKRVFIDGQDNLSEKDTFSYFDNSPVPVRTDALFDLQLEPGGIYAGDKYWRIWIDFDQDNEFENNEIVYSNSGNNNIYYAAIYIPTSAKSGITQMRVILKTGALPEDACEAITEGEVENYKIEIGSSSQLRNQSQQKNNTSSSFDDWQIFPNPARQVLNVDLTDYSKPIKNIRVIHSTGQIMGIYDVEEIDRGMLQIDLNRYSNGLYYLQVFGDREENQVKPFLINH